MNKFVDKTNMKNEFAKISRVAMLVLLITALPLLSYSGDNKDTVTETDSNQREIGIEPLDESKLPAPNEGYKWQILPEINAAFQMPTNWFYLNETKEGRIAYFFCKENIETERSYKTGLSINVVKELTDKVGENAAEYAKDVAIEMIRKTDTLATGASQFSTFQNFYCLGRIVGEDSTSIIVHNLLIGNSATDTFYMIIFEAPESDWEQADKIGQVMLNKFALDDEI